MKKTIEKLVSDYLQTLVKAFRNAGVQVHLESDNGRLTVNDLIIPYSGFDDFRAVYFLIDAAAVFKLGGVSLGADLSLCSDKGLKAAALADEPFMPWENDKAARELQRAECSGAEFAGAFNYAVPAISEGEGRRALEGVMVECRNGVVSLAGTDGRRLHVWEMLGAACNPCAERRAWTIPAGTLDKLIKPIAAAQNIILDIFETEGGQPFARLETFGADPFIFNFRFRCERCPEFRNVIPPSFARALDMPVAGDLDKALAMVCKVAGAKGIFKGCKFDKGLLMLCERADFSLNVPSLFDGFAFNPAFLLDAITGAAKVEINDEFAPVMLRHSNGRAFALLMPLRK